MQKISPMLWFNNQAEEAAKFYVSVFSSGKNSKLGTIARYKGKEVEAVAGMPDGSVMTVGFTLAGLEFTALNGGPIFNFTPAISFAVNCENEAEIDDVWAKLSAGGKALMPLDKYPFAKKFGWIQDKYGVSWQLILNEVPQSIVPYFMFIGPNFGRAEEAMKFYCEIFKNSKIKDMHKAGPGEPEKEGTISHATFELEGQPFMAMESSMDHKFKFSEAISLVINCDSQEEIDHYWDMLKAGGNPAAQQCGWLKDKYGVSWQVVPAVMGKLMSGPNAEKVTNAMLKMKKLDINELEKASKS